MTTVAPTSGPAVAVEFAGGQLDAYMARDLDAVPELADLLDDTQAKATYYYKPWTAEEVDTNVSSVVRPQVRDALLGGAL